VRKGTRVHVAVDHCFRRVECSDDPAARSSNA
jgi:hypothetical protein